MARGYVVRVAALLLIGAGAFLVTWQSVVLNLVVVVIFWIAFFLLLRSMFFSAPDEGQLARRKMAVLLGTTALSLTGVVLAILFIRPAREILTRTQGFAKYDVAMTPNEAAYAENLLKLLGWGPFDAKGRLGMWQTPVDPSRPKVFIVGDSVMYAWGVEEKETTAAYLDNLLPDYQVVNMGVSGWSIDQYYLYLRETLKRHPAEVVVVGVFAGNDFQITAREYGWGHSKPYFVVEDGELVHTNPDLLAFGCIDQMAQSFMFRHLWTDKFLAQAVLKTLCRAKSLDVAEGKEMIRALIKEIHGLGEEHDAQILFLLLPDINEFAHIGSDHYRRVASFYPFFKEVFRDGGYDYLEAGNFLGGSAEKLHGEYFVDQGHYTPRGHRILAEALRDYINENYQADP